MKQLQNLKCYVSGQSRLSRDSVLNTHTIAYEQPNFVWKLTSVPDVVIIYGMEAMIDELKQLLKKQNPNQMLSMTQHFVWVNSMCQHFCSGIQCSKKTQSYHFFFLSLDTALGHV